jgi:hypothetical protein
VNQRKHTLFSYALALLTCALLLATGCSKRNPIYERAKAQCPAANPNNPQGEQECERLEEQGAANCVDDPTPAQDEKCKQFNSVVIMGANSDWSRNPSGKTVPEPQIRIPPWNPKGSN